MNVDMNFEVGRMVSIFQVMNNISERGALLRKAVMTFVCSFRRGISGAWLRRVCVTSMPVPPRAAAAVGPIA